MCVYYHSIPFCVLLVVLTVSYLKYIVILIEWHTFKQVFIKWMKQRLSLFHNNLSALRVKWKKCHK